MDIWLQIPPPEFLSYDSTEIQEFLQLSHQNLHKNVLYISDNFGEFKMITFFGRWISLCTTIHFQEATMTYIWVMNTPPPSKSASAIQIWWPYASKCERYDPVTVTHFWFMTAPSPRYIKALGLGLIVWEMWYGHNLWMYSQKIPEEGQWINFGSWYTFPIHP